MVLIKHGSHFRVFALVPVDGLLAGLVLSFTFAGFRPGAQFAGSEARISGMDCCLII